ncbi:MAG: nucleotide sugar dehydrogenase [Eubacterium sp.]|nr:nucleotide sugar dehydrogenase [Eubacterium sp.]
MRIGIVGLGYVGLTLGIAAANSGIEVYGIEVDSQIQACLRKNRAHFYEPGLDALIKKVNKKSFFAVDAFPTELFYDAFIITVGTPLKKGEKEPDFDYIRTALHELRPVYTGKELVILRSTVSVGTTRRIVLPELARMAGRQESEILVSMCPERTVEGKAVEELKKLPQIISGNNEKSLEIAQRLFRHMTPYVIPVRSLEEAELVKLYCNTYRDLTFAIGNVFCRTAQTFGVDGMEVITHANQGYDRANICIPGFAAGPCLEKDAYILTNNLEESSGKRFIMSGRAFNESLEDMVVEWVEERIGSSPADKILAISGLAFKGTPETSDLRGSSSVYIAEKLVKKGYRLRLHDFVTLKKELQALQLGEVYEDLYEACQGVSMLLVLNNHKKYSMLEAVPEIKKGKAGSKKGRLAVLDIWDVCSNWKYDAHVDVFTIGNMYIRGGANKA